MMGMEHERIHIETSSVLIRQLPIDLVQKPEGWIYAPNKCGMLRFQKGIKEINFITNVCQKVLKPSYNLTSLLHVSFHYITFL